MATRGRGAPNKPPRWPPVHNPLRSKPLVVIPEEAEHD